MGMLSQVVRCSCLSDALRLIRCEIPRCREDTVGAGHVDGSWRTVMADFHHLSILEGVREGPGLLLELAGLLWGHS